MMKNVFHSWQFFALCSAAFAALTAIFGKLGVSHINSNLATFIRTVIIVGVIAVIISTRSEWAWGTVSRNTLLFLFLSALATGFSWLCYYRALQLGPASRVAPVDKLSVVLVMALSVLFLGESLTWKVIVGGLLITSGAILLAL